MTKPRAKYDSHILPGAYSATGYHSARVGNREGWIVGGGGGTRHQLLHRKKLIEQSRAFHRDNQIYERIIDAVVAYTIGRGFILQAKTATRANAKTNSWNAKAESLWKEYWHGEARTPEYRNLITGIELERTACRELMTCGDFGTVKMNDGTVQLIEAEQIDSYKNVAQDGVVKDKEGRVTGYHVVPYDTQGNLKLNHARLFESKDGAFIYCGQLLRPSEYRAVPPAQASFAQLHRTNDLLDSEAVAAQVQARLALLVNREEGAERAFEESATDETKTAEDGDIGDRVSEWDYGLVFHGEIDENVSSMDRSIPGKNFPETVRMFLRIAGMASGLPLEIILLDWTQSNYSQSRAVLQQAFLTFTARQKLLINCWYSNIYRWKITEWIAAGKLSPRPDQFAHDWIVPEFPWIDALKETQAHGEKLDRGLTTYSQVIKAQNEDPDSTFDIRKQEIIRAQEAAKEIEKQTGIPTPWRPLAGMKELSSPGDGTTEDGNNASNNQPK